MFSQNTVILLLVASGGGPRSLFTMEVSALEDNSLVEVDDDDLIDSVLHNLTNEDIVDLTSTTSTTAAQQPHFRDDPLILIYSSGKDRSFSSKNVAEEIMNGVSTHLISSLVPHQPNENIAFMIGTQYLGHWKDVLSDNLGSWKNDGTKTLYYSTSHKASREIKLKPSSEEDAKVLVNRSLCVYPKTPFFGFFCAYIYKNVYILLY